MSKRPTKSGQDLRRNAREDFLGLRPSVAALRLAQRYREIEQAERLLDEIAIQNTIANIKRNKEWQSMVNEDYTSRQLNAQTKKAIAAKKAKAARANRKKILKKKRAKRLLYKVRLDRYLKREAKKYEPFDIDADLTPKEIAEIEYYQLGGPPLPMDEDESTRGQKRAYDDMVDEPLYDDRGRLISM